MNAGSVLGVACSRPARRRWVRYSTVVAVNTPVAPTMWIATSLLDKGHGQLKFLVPRDVHWLDLVLPPALFGLWLAVMLVILRTRPLLARVERSPYEEGASHHAHAAA